MTPSPRPGYVPLPRSTTSRQPSVLPADAFSLALDLELKRARLSRGAFTLVVFEATRPSDDGWTGDAAAAKELCRVIRACVREADLLGETGNGTLTLVLADAGAKDSQRAITRLISRVEASDLLQSRQLTVGVASFPDQGFDADSLRQRARSRLVVIGAHA
ncbi:MAG: hypothetical protein ACM3SQ_17920 [Betaproteobacteria bacterium]